MRHALASCWRPCLTILTWSVVGGCAARGQVPTKTQPVAVSLPTRVAPLEVTSATTDAALAALRNAPQPGLHVLARFPSHPSIPERERLRAAGITVLTPYFGTTYWIRSIATADSALKARSVTLALVPAQYRVEPAIWNGQYARFVVTPQDSVPINYVQNADGTVNVTVTFHDDVQAAEGSAIVRRYARDSVIIQSDRRWVIRLQPAALRLLAAEDAVRWIDAAPPPPLPDNDLTRAFLNVDVVQNFNVATGTVQGVGGQGVRVGVFDTGIDETHDDFGTRVVQNDAGADVHATHVAGTIAGSGVASNHNDSQGISNGGTAFQWRGMAPQAEIVDVPSSRAFTAANWLTYIQTRSIDISNHSYSFSFDGAYDNDNQLLDQIARGGTTSGGVAIPPREQVYSAGNHGQAPLRGGEQVGYFALTKQVKNGILVGNFDRAQNQIAQSSSLGPAHDGRIKPDVVTPGTNVRSTATAGARRDFYLSMSGTSMAAPAATGTLALVLQQYAATYGVNLDVAPPWPSTLKAALIQTATDVTSGAAWFTNADAPVQAFAGPDFVTGFGVVNAQAAVALVANRQLLQDSIATTCDTAKYWLRVAAATPEVRVTLAWDDFEGNPALAATAPQLVNDLDLVLVQPNGTPHYPWLLDQLALDGTGTAVADANQTCGSTLTIQRAVLPTLTPNFVNAGNPANVNDPIPAGALQGAVRGKDHLNNVEQVLVAAPAAGLWQVLVIGFNVAQPRQRFSLVGFNPARLIVIDPRGTCRRFAFFCNDFRMLDLCRRYPDICHPRYFVPKFGILPINFVSMNDRVVIPGSDLRDLIVSPEGGTIGETQGASTVRLTIGKSPIAIDVYSARTGKKLRTSATDNSASLNVDVTAQDEVILVMRPTAGALPKTVYNISVGTVSR